MSDQPVLSAEPATSPAGHMDSEASRQTLSKKAAKRAAKEERYAATKLERRAREREAKKEKKRLQAEKRASGELEDDDEDQGRKPKKRRVEFGGRVVVDLGFDSLMTGKEIKSLCSQLAYTYSANRHASFPFDLVFSSLDGQTLERLNSMSDAGYKRWASTDWWKEGIERLWLGPDEGPPEATAKPEDIRAKVVYLTADSEDELTELNPGEIYVIGGICDHNRYKVGGILRSCLVLGFADCDGQNLCLNKANQLAVRTAKLPIGRYLASMSSRKVLTVNQCFEILVSWVATRDWQAALCTVVPQRKFVATPSVVEHTDGGDRGDTTGAAARE